MNKNELKHILENNFLDILGKIFNYMSEELAQTNEQDTKALEKIDNKLKEKVELLKQEFNSIDENKKKVFQIYCQNIFLQEIIQELIITKTILKNGVKIGIKLIVETIK